MTSHTKEANANLRRGTRVLFDEIEDPGAYHLNLTGNLIRIPDHGLKAGSSPTVDIIGKEPMIVTKLSSDPYCTISKARMVAADLDLEVNF